MAAGAAAAQARSLRPPRPIRGGWRPGRRYGSKPPATSLTSDVGFNDDTVRNVVFTTVGGTAVRIRLSNLFGRRPLDIGQASLGEVASAGSLTGPAFPVTFNNSRSVVVPVGQEVLSDPIPMSVSPLEDIAVSVYLPDRTGPATYHLFGQQDSYLAPGNHVNDVSDAAYPTRTTSWYFLDAVEVMGAYKRAGVMVAFGDSITDGVGSTDGTNGRWPDFLPAGDGQDGNEAPAVIDEGVGGNRVPNNSVCFGQSALARFSRTSSTSPACGP